MLMLWLSIYIYIHKEMYIFVCVRNVMKIILQKKKMFYYKINTYVCS